MARRLIRTRAKSSRCCMWAHCLLGGSPTRGFASRLDAPFLSKIDRVILARALGGAAVAAGLAAALVAIVGCGRTAPQAAAPVSAQEAPVSEFQWTITSLQVAVAVNPGQEVTGVANASLQSATATALTELGLVSAVGGAGDPSPLTWAGLDLQVSWQAEDAAGMAVAVAAPTAVALGVQMRAQAAAHVATGGQAELAWRVATVQLPKPVAIVDLSAWLIPRLSRAAAHTAADVLAELWARRLDNAAVAAGLLHPDVWRASACAREAGDRGLHAERKPLEKLCKDTRKDVALVACTALGRLGGIASIATLDAALRARHPDVIAAALDALAMVRNEAALQVLRQAAKDHEIEPVRVRAAQLVAEVSARLAQESTATGKGDYP
ncbi:MAG: HEAT repeat domain-containing protein [Myxococcales bacterium]|nr:HEAT repeat domain-containing protein [Myxococcales bacterium]